MSTKLFRTATLTLAVSIALGTAPAYAEESSSKVKVKDVERIAVVGSRSAPRSVADSPVPIDIIGADDLAKLGSTDMLDQLVGAIPSFNVHANPISDAATLVRPVNLRGLSSDSTLVLLNGKRRHRASVIAFQGGGINDGAQGPDISVIPSIALKQVEVLRDGAAAQYGSDAIAGVMNFVLKDAAEGGSFSVKHGEYYEGDGGTTTYAGNVGMPLTKDGFANLSFQYKNADATSRSNQVANAATISAAGNTFIAEEAQVWGSPEINDDISLFGNIGLDLGNDKKFYMFGNYSERDVQGGFYWRNPHNRSSIYSNDGGETLLVGDLDGVDSGITCPTIAIGSNVLNQADYQSIADNSTPLGQNCFAVNETYPGGYTPNFGGNVVDTSLTVGVEGEIKGGMLDEVFFDISGSVGRNKSSFSIVNTINSSMGPESPHDFDLGNYTQLEKTFNLDLSKGVDVGFDNPMNVAGGLEWREETFEIGAGDQYSFLAGPLIDQGFNLGSHGFPGFQPSQAGVFSRRSVAAYVDVEAYITDDFLLGAALRYEDFSSFGDTLNYKLTAQYAINDELSVRGSISTGFRAPTVGQANVSNVSTALEDGELTDSALLPPTSEFSKLFGGKELEPEESQSYAFGVVYQNGDLFFTADYYNIEVDDRITQSDRTKLEDADYAKLEALNVANPRSVGTVSFFANDFDTTTEGVDVVASYGMDLFEGSTKFSLAYNWNETDVTNSTDITGAFKVKRLEEGLPKHRGSFTVSQSWDDISVYVRANYFGEYHAVHVDYDLAAQDADAAVTVDAEMSYFINDSFTISVGAQNILDQDAEELDFEESSRSHPDGFTPNSQWGGKYYETSPFGFNGGFYYAKLTYNF
ncbi:MAG: TonB-dependent receptor [Colwellia sp.]|jgi:iron complex outermembrane receptor protein|uniref:TonB-dependent receptor plug domain-containing protein n=1 Tax=Colwellia sp. Bg11-12 TaxID=2759817 RepID=UPI0015F5FD93|nr:TonB-dependent receptor [Colwellia sp. Bg11-12]MBA6264821.1 TonB-dependent receptor [Colwellia sp. Bg11-12]